MNMRQSAGWLSVIVVLLAGMSLVARGSPPGVSDARQAGEVAMVTTDCGKTEPPFAFEITPMTDWITDSGASQCLTYVMSVGSPSRVDLDGDGTEDFVVVMFAKDPASAILRWARITSEGMLDTTDLVFTPDLFDLPSLGGDEVWTGAHPRAFEDMNGDGLPDLIFLASTTAPGPVYRSRFFYSLNTNTPPPAPLIGDVDGDGIVGILDFLLVLANWGPCP